MKAAYKAVFCVTIYSMKTAIILHGMPTKKEYMMSRTPSQSNRHWLAWLQKQLILKNILAQTPEFPTPYNPKYKEWCKMFERFDINEDTMLVGHSLGGGFLVRWLSEHRTRVGKVALVAPWMDPRGIIKNDFFDFKIDPDLAKKTKQLSIFISSDDMKEVRDSVVVLRKTLKGRVRYREFSSKGHFDLEGLRSDKFPELRDELLK